MIASLTLTVLMDNSAPEELESEHGLSFWLEADGVKVWFDFGQSSKTLANASRLHIPATEADALVLSHGHYDHGGGLAYALEIAPYASLYMHPDVCLERYSYRPPGLARFIGLPGHVTRAIQKHVQRVSWIEKPTEISNHIWLTGPIPRVSTVDVQATDFFTNAAATMPDVLRDDQALFVEMKAGVFVLVGCAHAGIINTLEYIRTLTGNAPILGLAGGLHLSRLNETELAKNLATLMEYKIPTLVPCHCTGDMAVEGLRKCCQVLAGGAGTRLKFV